MSGYGPDGYVGEGEPEGTPVIAYVSPAGDQGRYRDTWAEQFWHNQPAIGYVALNDDGTPLQPTIGSGWRARKKPITVYKTLATALKQSPIVAEVRMFAPIYEPVDLPAETS